MTTVRGILLLSLCATFCGCKGARVLVVSPFALQSHINVVVPIIKGLAARGHHVTVLTGKALSRGTQENVTQLLMEPIEGGQLSQIRKQLGSEKSTPHGFVYNVLTNLIAGACSEPVQHPTVQRLVSSDATFDLVLLDAFMCECMLPLSHIFSAHLVMYTPSYPMPWNNVAIGNPNNYNTDWQFFLWQSPKRGQPMGFIDRTIALVLSVGLHVYRDYATIPQFDAIVRQSYPQGKDLPPLHDLERNTRLLLANTHFSITGIRPNVPAYVDIAGVHCVPSNPLPKELEDFVSTKNGFVFISFGGTIPTDALSESTRQKLVQVFARLPQRVLWKWDSVVDDLPANVRTYKWLPQQDILGHKNLRAFITQGGALSLQEAVYHGAPILGLPLAADQEPNVQRLVDAGVALTLDLKGAPAEVIYQALTQLINEHKYQQNAKRLSELFRDQPETPLERAIGKIEMVLRHNGAPFLRSAALDLRWYQYFLLDIIGALISILVAAVTLLWLVVHFLRKLLRSIKQKTE